MIRRFRSAKARCLILHGLLVAVVMAEHILTHGGMRGDVYPDAPPEAFGYPPVLFNRWTLDHDPSWLAQALVLLDLPAALVAHATWAALHHVPEFQEPQPFGLSSASYSRLLLVVGGFVQWGAIGALVDRRQRRLRVGIARSPDKNT